MICAVFHGDGPRMLRWVVELDVSRLPFDVLVEAGKRAMLRLGCPEPDELTSWILIDFICLHIVVGGHVVDRRLQEIWHKREEILAPIQGTIGINVHDRRRLLSIWLGVGRGIASRVVLAPICSMLIVVPVWRGSELDVAIVGLCEGRRHHLLLAMNSLGYNSDQQ